MSFEDYQKNLQRAAVAGAFNKATDRLKTLRESRVKAERDAIKFDLDTKVAKAKLKEMENDPFADPAIVEMKKRNVMALLDSQGAVIERNKGYIDADMQPAMQTALKLGFAYNRMTQEELARQNQNNGVSGQPEMSEWDKMIMSSSVDKSGIISSKLNNNGTSATLESNKIREQGANKRLALKMATDQFTGEVDESKYQAALKKLGVAGDESQQVGDQSGRGSAEETVQMEAPDGSVYSVPKSSVEKYQKKGAKIVE